MTKILMLVAVWRRPEILAMFINNLERVQCDYAEVLPFFILSPEDPELNQVEALTDGYLSTFAKNDPLGEKLNIGLLQALELDWNYMIGMGSDDLFTIHMWQQLEDYFMTGEPYFGFINFHAYDYYGGRAKFIPEYHLNLNDELTCIGPGRCLRRDVIETVIPLYPAIHSGLDGNSDKKLQAAGFKPALIDNGNIPTICDVKTNCHLTPWEYFDDMGEDVDGQFIQDVFCIRKPCKAMPLDEFHMQVLKGATEITRKESFEQRNYEHYEAYGKLRYSSIESYKTVISRKHKKQ